MKSMTRTLILILVAAFALMFLANRLNSSQGYSSGNTLTIYNWGDYIDPELLDRFQEETGITVIYQTFDSNEAMLTKIEQGGTTFDVAVPSDYAIEKMREEKLLIPLDHDKIPNMKYIDPKFLDLSFDPGNEYSMPYFWGTLGVVYNPKLTDLKFESWEDLWDPTLRNDVLLTDGAREVIGTGLVSRGYSLNDTNGEHLQQALDHLMDLSPNVKAIVGDEIKLLLANGEAAAGLVFSGDASEIMSENEDLDYVVPEEGSNLYFDNMVVPKTAQNVDGAMKFINFMLDPEVNAQNTEYVGYSTPNDAALALLPEEISGDERFYPPDELTERLEVYENLGKKMLVRYNELFLQFKMNGS
ncbi:ABC transporter substrate-binding protein [Saccharibacillus alkalitolerans]|uniref:ABC transporter substrate-binding protein n=1 Tax=Saccharibacillus alkalitolerans TaxID=2705290 RepID=A0ABX0F774_9BACL|nr:ABC transporter substrate-binding protein [Saccharibacillus alkalitolerans]NGZ76295.1 ABC transporter substrate-binding protein [Saccharibacillus alkalitolerans]